MGKILNHVIIAFGFLNTQCLVAYCSINSSFQLSVYLLPVCSIARQRRRTRQQPQRCTVYTLPRHGQCPQPAIGSDANMGQVPSHDGEEEEFELLVSIWLH